MCTAWIQIVHSQHRIKEFWWILIAWKEENIVLFEHSIHEPGFLARWVFMSWSGTWLNTVPSFIGHGPCFLLVTALFSYGTLGTCMVDVFWTQTLDDSILKAMVICVHLQDSYRAWCSFWASASWCSSWAGQCPAMCSQCTVRWGQCRSPIKWGQCWVITKAQANHKEDICCAISTNWQGPRSQVRCHQRELCGEHQDEDQGSKHWWGQLLQVLHERPQLHHSCASAGDWDSWGAQVAGWWFGFEVAGSEHRAIEVATEPVAVWVLDGQWKVRHFVRWISQLETSISFEDFAANVWLPVIVFGCFRYILLIYYTSLYLPMFFHQILVYSTRTTMATEWNNRCFLRPNGNKMVNLLRLDFNQARCSTNRAGTSVRGNCGFQNSNQRGLTIFIN